RVTWTAPFDGGSLITGYELRITDPAGTQVVRSTTDTTLTVTGLTNGTTYRFAVRAINEEGPGPYSPQVTGVPRTTPEAPQMTGVDPRNRSVRVRWADPADDGGSPITGYRVLVLTLDGRQVGSLRRADALANQLLVTGLQNGRSYRFRVQALNAVGASPWSTSMRTRPSAG
ncbi:MAG TPA: fibronectin type III domain-containing protein, partial [Nocardioides sp.]|nr:fibronectin type III domain-containing protein [Nocardioides sp.]